MNIDRRQALKNMALFSSGIFYQPFINLQLDQMSKRPIPSSKEDIPVLGLGTWQTFDVGNSASSRKPLQEVLNEMIRLGGTMIDSSPMYGSSERVVGDLSQTSDNANHFFYATKVWTSGKEAGIRQMNKSFALMQREVMDLMQIHNLLDWKTHLKTLRKWKEEGKIRYWGFTHYTDYSHEELARLIKSERPDFVQFNFSINDRHAERFLLPTAREYGTACIINRPYGGGTLFRKVKGKELPTWAAEYDIASWGQYFLKYILGNEGVTCVIPGTSKVRHLVDNMQAGYGRLPDEKAREKMIQFLNNL